MEVSFQENIGVLMATNVIDTIASDLTRLQSNPNYYRNNPKLYTSSGILLESYAKVHKLSIEELQKLVKMYQ